MSKKQPKAPKAPTLSFTVLVGGEAYTGNAEALQGDALAKEIAAAVDGIKSADAFSVNAERAAWEAATHCGRVYGAFRAAGMDDGDAYTAIASRSDKEDKKGLLNKAGVNKSSAQRFAAAGRALFAGVPRKDGETLKAYASRVGGATPRAERKPNPSKAAHQAAVRAVKLAGELRVALAEAGAGKRDLDLCDTLASRAATLEAETGKAVEAEKAGKAK